ncbi:MAG TPA: lysogenization regulator HflD [Thioalkalivibrio sp.]|nr:lysogenization regulator HflD [Thioalkalivibrio sp.]
MTPSNENRAIAMAALFQCAELVRQVAWEGSAEPAPFETCIKSLFTLDADTVEAIYGDLSQLRLGFTVLEQQLGQDNAGRDMEITRYVITLLHLERRLRKRPDLVTAIQEGIQAAEKQFEFFAPTHANTVARLADVYQNSISKMGPRIIVQGDQGHLSNPDNASRIRALLLAGIRAAVLWRQAGGTRWNLIFGRAKLVAAARRLGPH